MPTALLIGLLVAVIALIALQELRQPRGRSRRRAPWKKDGERLWPKPVDDRPLTDAADQLRLVMRSQFSKRRLMSKAEAQVFFAAEKAIAAQKLTWRVMAQVSLGEILSSPDARAYSTINSKRVDVLIVTRGGDPIAAIEYQGSGHHQGTAPARDAVKKEALRRAGVRYIEYTPEHNADDLAREIQRIAAEMLRSSLKS